MLADLAAAITSDNITPWDERYGRTGGDLAEAAEIIEAHCVYYGLSPAGMATA